MLFRSSDSPFISPMIDTVRNNALIIRNLVDFPQISYNEFYNNGPSRTKYISKIITLAQGQDAQDLQVILTAHRPPGTDIKVYVKLLSGEDPDVIIGKFLGLAVHLKHDRIGFEFNGV